MTDALDEAALFEILSSTRRRESLRALRDLDCPVRVGTLADAVEQREAELRPAEELPSNLRNSIYNTMVQNHVPRMDAVDIVRFDPEVKEIREGPNYQIARDVLEAAVASFRENGTGDGR